MTNFINSISFEEEFEAAKKEESKLAEESSQAVSSSKPWHKTKSSDHQSFESWRKQNNSKEQASAPNSEQTTPSKGKYSLKPHQDRERDKRQEPERDGKSRNYASYDRDSATAGYEHSFDDVQDVSSKDRPGRYATAVLSSSFVLIFFVLIFVVLISLRFYIYLLFRSFCFFFFFFFFF
jgi:hypothetical protein